jgi:hypothetical protein
VPRRDARRVCRVTMCTFQETYHPVYARFMGVTPEIRSDSPPPH